MASRNCLLLGLLFSIILCVGSAHRLLSESVTATEPPTTSHHPAYAPSTGYAESHHLSYPPMRRQNPGYALGTRPFPLTPPTPPPSPSTEPPTPPRRPFPLTPPTPPPSPSTEPPQPPPTSAASGDDSEWTWTYKALAPLDGINSGNDQTIPVIWPDFGGASQDPFASELNYVYEEPPPRESNN